MNGYTYGIFIDVLQVLEEQLNFTCFMFARSDLLWGKVETLSNGSIVGYGLTEDLYRGRVDLAVASMTITVTRAKYITFTRPILDEVLTAVIPSSSVMEDYDFGLFFGPLHNYTWILILATAILVVLLHTIASRNYQVISILATFWSSLMAFLGGSHLSEQSGKLSCKIITIALLLGGYVIWTSHNAFLTAQLVTVKKIYPFTDSESMSSTNWK